jgi:phage repressor protein C with HTH and peptisase S24 domain
MKGATIGNRLRQERARLGKSQEEVSNATGIPIDTYRKYEGDSRVPGGEALAAMAKMGINVPLVLTGMDEMRRIRAATDAVVRFALKRSGLSGDRVADLQAAAFRDNLDEDALERLYGASTHGEEPRIGYTYIPLLDVSAQAGGGRLVGHSEPVVDVLAFKEDWIRQELRKSPEDLRLIFVDGDSMEPELRSGDIVLVDSTDTNARREGVYVIRMDGALLVKQLQRLPGGGIRVVSANPSYETFMIQVADLENGKDFNVVGRVVWACRRF